MIYCLDMFFPSNFTDYKWGMEAFLIAHDRVVNGRKNLLIIILKEKMNLDNLPQDLRTYIRKTILCKNYFQ